MVLMIAFACLSLNKLNMTVFSLGFLILIVFTVLNLEFVCTVVAYSSEYMQTMLRLAWNWTNVLCLCVTLALLCVVAGVIECSMRWLVFRTRTMEFIV